MEERRGRRRARCGSSNPITNKREEGEVAVALDR
jgi:hypothetical protein